MIFFKKKIQEGVILKQQIVREKTEELRQIEAFLKHQWRSDGIDDDRDNGVNETLDHVWQPS